MPLAPITFPDHFTLTVQAQDNTLAHTWSNSIDIAVAAAAGAPQPTDPIVNAFQTFLATMLRTDSHLSKATMRAWTRNVQPFGSQGFVWENIINIPGTCYTAADPYGNIGQGNPTLGEVVLLAAKSNFDTGGKVGHISLRNMFRDEDVQAVAGGPPIWIQGLNHPTAAAFNTSAETHLGSFFQDAPLPRFVNVHWSKKQQSVPFDSAIGALTAERISTRNLSHKSKK